MEKKKISQQIVHHQGEFVLLLNIIIKNHQFLCDFRVSITVYGFSSHLCAFINSIIHLHLGLSLFKSIRFPSSLTGLSSCELLSLLVMNSFKARSVSTTYYVETAGLTVYKICFTIRCNSLLLF